tara:strand:+ start:3013 stop:3390 length:378 start_codon:yes stop_codon:yes gene_type:complete
MSDPLLLIVLGGGLFAILLTVVLLHKKQVELSISIGREMASQIMSFSEVVDEIASIPGILQELNLGGVELRPPKSLVELGFEWLMNRDRGEGVNSTPPLAELWPEQDQEQPRTEPEGVEDLPSAS